MYSECSQNVVKDSQNVVRSSLGHLSSLEVDSDQGVPSRNYWVSVMKEPNLQYNSELWSRKWNLMTTMQQWEKAIWFGFLIKDSGGKSWCPWYIIRIGTLPQSWTLLAKRSQSVSHLRSLEVIGGRLNSDQSKAILDDLEALWWTDGLMDGMDGYQWS